MSSPRPGLQCLHCGRPFLLFHSRPDVSHIGELPNPFGAVCVSCGQKGAYNKSAIALLADSLPVEIDAPVMAH